jgi:hypothetical protein
MKSSTLSWIALILAAMALLLLRLDWQGLPEKVAVHFDAAGRPNRWDSRQSLAVSTAVLHLGVAGVLVLVTSFLHRLPPSTMNLPKSGYWRRPENYPQACRISREWARWFATGQLVWATLMDRQLMLANQLRPPRLDSEAVWMLTAAFVGFTLLSIGLMLIRLNRVPREAEAGAA